MLRVKTQRSVTAVQVSIYLQKEKRRLSQIADCLSVCTIIPLYLCSQPDKLLLSSKPALK